MQRRYGLRILLSVVVVATTVYSFWRAFQPIPQLPFTVRWVDAREALVEPIPGMTPASLQAGDRLVLAEQAPATRIALVASEWVELPDAARYPLVVERHAARVPVTVQVVDGNSGGLVNWSDWVGVYSNVLFAAISLLALWRGHDRAAWGMAFWAMLEVPLSQVMQVTPASADRIALLALIGSSGLSLSARIGFYVMAESVAGNAVRAGRRAVWRMAFALSLGAATIVFIGGPVVAVAAGWADLLRPALQWLVPISYLVPVALLAASFPSADAPQRQRLRWLLWGSAAFMTGLIVYDVRLPLSHPVVAMLDNALTTLAAVVILYAVLRHRVVDVTVAINRALVYALTTSFVLGLFALMESLIERSALGHDAGLVLELAVPLGVGAALSTVHRRVEATVERLIFRRQYRAEMALRRFAEECGFISETENLFKLGVEQIARQTEAPRVALYERSPGGYVCRRQHGETALPETVAKDDPAFVGLRARNAELALHGRHSQLGSEGYAYPLMLRGDLLGALVVSERPGERYAADERELLFHVAHEMAAALFALRAQELEARVNESEARSRTHELLLQEARSREAALLNAFGASGSVAEAR